jgi:hypothetical protein
LNLEGYSITLTPSDTGSTAITLAGDTSVGNSTTSANLTVTGSIYLDSTSGPYIQTDTSGDIDLHTTSGTVNISGSDTQTITSPNNLYIQSGTSTSPQGLNLEGYSITLTPSDTGSTAITLAGDTSVGNSTTSANLTVTGSIYLDSTSGPYIKTDTSGDIDLHTTSGTVNISGSDTQTITSPNNLYIQSGTSTSPQGLNLEGYSITLTPSDTGSTAITLAGNTSVSGSTTLGTNSTAISNIQFGNTSFNDISASESEDFAGNTINLYFTPTSIVFGVGTNSLYPASVQYLVATPTSGYTWSCTPYLILPQGNGGSSNYTVSWIAIA